MSEFEEFARSQGFSGDFQRGCNRQYKSDLLHFMEKAFMHQQAKIELLEKEITETQAFLNNQNHIKQAEIDRLNSVLDERTKEWLQAIECGTYFENVAKPLKAENDELQKRINDALFKMRQQSLVLREDMDGYKDPVQLCQSEGFDMCVKILEKALRGEHE